MKCLKTNHTVKGNCIYLPDLVGKGYGTFWRWKRRYRVCKGSRASKKSKTTALWYIINMMKYPDANTLVVRKTYRTLKDSCFTELKWAVNRLGVQMYWDTRKAAGVGGAPGHGRVACPNPGMGQGKPAGNDV